MFQGRKSRKAEAAAFLRSLDSSKKYQLQKIAVREGRKPTVHVGHATVGELKLIYAKDVARDGSQYDPDDFMVFIQGERIHDWLRTSLIMGCGKTDDGVILIETLNSVYRLVEVA